MSRVFGGCRALMAAKSGAKASIGGPNLGMGTAAAASSKARTGILKPVPVSAALRKFLGGAPEISRAEAVKKVWEHIKLNQLQNPANKREIYCDDKLKIIFDGRDKVGFLEISRLLSPHFVKTN